MALLAKSGDGLNGTRQAVGHRQTVLKIPSGFSPFCSFPT
jgi:hypothetical protein